MEWKIEYENEVGANEAFSEWWTVTNGKRSFRCNKEDAEALFSFIQASENLAMLCETNPFT